MEATMRRPWITSAFTHWRRAIRWRKLPLHPKGKEELLKKLKKSLGCGGTVKEGHLELQGDKKTQTAAMLEKEGYKVRIL